MMLLKKKYLFLGVIFINLSCGLIAKKIERNNIAQVFFDQKNKPNSCKPFQYEFYGNHEDNLENFLFFLNQIKHSSLSLEKIAVYFALNQLALRPDVVSHHSFLQIFYYQKQKLVVFEPHANAEKNYFIPLQYFLRHTKIKKNLSSFISDLNQYHPKVIRVEEGLREYLSTHKTELSDIKNLYERYWDIFIPNRIHREISFPKLSLKLPTTNQKIVKDSHTPQGKGHQCAPKSKKSFIYSEHARQHLFALKKNEKVIYFVVTHLPEISDHQAMTSWKNHLSFAAFENNKARYCWQNTPPKKTFLLASHTQDNSQLLEKYIKPLLLSSPSTKISKDLTQKRSLKFPSPERVVSEQTDPIATQIPRYHFFPLGKITGHVGSQFVLDPRYEEQAKCFSF